MGRATAASPTSASQPAGKFTIKYKMWIVNCIVGEVFAFIISSYESNELFFPDFAPHFFASDCVPVFCI